MNNHGVFEGIALALLPVKMVEAGLGWKQCLSVDGRPPDPQCHIPAAD